MFSATKRLIVTWIVILGIAATSYGAIAGAECPKVGFTTVEPHATPETRPLKVSRNRTIFVGREWITTTSDIVEIKLERPFDGERGDVNLLIKFTPEADQRLHDATTNVSGKRFAFLFDEQVLLNFEWEGPYGMYTGGTKVSIQRGLKQAEKLMKAIQGCTAAAAGVGAAADREP